MSKVEQVGLAIGFPPSLDQVADPSYPYEIAGEQMVPSVPKGQRCLLFPRQHHGADIFDYPRGPTIQENRPFKEKRQTLDKTA